MPVSKLMGIVAAFLRAVTQPTESKHRSTDTTVIHYH